MNMSFLTSPNYFKSPPKAGKPWFLTFASVSRFGQFEEEKAYVCKKLGITAEEFDKIMNEPAKIYRDYPNAEKRLEFIYNIYRKVFKAPSYKGE